MIIIKKAIMHILNNKENKKAIAEFELELNDPVKNLIIKHIITSQKHDYRKIAVFSKNENLIKNSCEKMFLDDSNFISESQNIANHLFDSMKGTASPANFIICLYEEDNIKWIALLKMDFNENYKPLITEIDGKTKVSIEILKGTLPNKSQKLQKCIFISNKIYQGESDEFFILDKQSGEEVSDYFKIDFLHCDLKNSDRDNTKGIVKGLGTFIQEKYASNQLTGKKTMDKMWKILLEKKGKNIGVPELVETLFEDNEETVEEALEKLKCENFDFEFIADDKYISQRSSKRRIETGIGITLFGDNLAFTRENFEMTDEDENGNVTIIIKNVKIKEKI